MLLHLHIENYVLIDSLDIDFEEGFSVITGETGAGKSILLGAIGLLLGRQADHKAIKAEARRCVVEAEFSTEGDEGLRAYLEEEDLTDEGEPPVDGVQTTCTVRRELTANGRSRAFVNDTPAQLSQLRRLGELVIDIHSQNETQLLRSEAFQLSVVDTVAQSSSLLGQYQDTYRRLTDTARRLREAEEAQASDERERDYTEFQLSQLTDARLVPDEQERLEAEQRTLEHAEEIKERLYAASTALDDEERGVLASLRGIRHSMETLTEVYPQASQLAGRLDSCLIELTDIGEETERSLSSVEDDPARLAEVGERLNLIYELLRKHHAASVGELIETQRQLQERLDNLSSRDDLIRELRQEVETLTAELSERAALLSRARAGATEGLEREVCQRLRPLGMKAVRFSVELTPLAKPGPTGGESARFLMSANEGHPLQPLSSTASGGETSRLMLTLKAIMGERLRMPTVIFDEIDTGVGGHVAEAMGRAMQGMAKGQGRQVIAITHLPQIAALGQRHYLVYKEAGEDGVTGSRIARIEGEQRVRELAHMLSGSQLTQAALDNAAELLSATPQAGDSTDGRGDPPVSD